MFYGNCDNSKNWLNKQINNNSSEYDYHTFLIIRDKFKKSRRNIVINSMAFNFHRSLHPKYIKAEEINDFRYVNGFP